MAEVYDWAVSRPADFVWRPADFTGPSSMMLMWAAANEAAANEPAVRQALESQLSSGKAPNIEKAVQAVLHHSPAIDYGPEPEEPET
jgi:hypothetical protein